jgi:hypothetical protein
MADPADELRAAVEASAHREHWTVDGEVAVYDPPDLACTAVVRASARPTSWRDSWYAAQIQDGVATHALTCGSAAQAVRWCERGG